MLINILLIIIPFTMAYGLHFIGITFKIKELLLYIPSIIVILVLAISSLYYLFKSNKYSLLSKIIISKDVSYCPHGRPVVHAFSHKEIDKMFKRIK